MRKQRPQRNAKNSLKRPNSQHRAHCHRPRPFVRFDLFGSERRWMRGWFLPLEAHLLAFIHSSLTWTRNERKLDPDPSYHVSQRFLERRGTCERFFAGYEAFLHDARHASTQLKGLAISLDSRAPEIAETLIEAGENFRR